MTAPDRPIAAAERVTHFLTLFCIGSLLAVYGLTRLASDAFPFWPGGLGILLLLTAPLLACVPAVLRWQRTAFGVLSLLALVYFGLAMWTLMDPALKWVGIAELGFALGLFFASASFLRIQGRRLAEETAQANAISARGSDSGSNGGSGGGDDLPKQDS